MCPSTTWYPSFLHTYTHTHTHTCTHAHTHAYTHTQRIKIEGTCQTCAHQPHDIQVFFKESRSIDHRMCPSTTRYPIFFDVFFFCPKIDEGSKTCICQPTLSRILCFFWSRNKDWGIQTSALQPLYNEFFLFVLSKNKDWGFFSVLSKNKDWGSKRSVR